VKEGECIKGETRKFYFRGGRGVRELCERKKGNGGIIKKRVNKIISK